MWRTPVLVAALAVGLAAPPVLAADAAAPGDEASLDLLLTTIRSNRRALVSINLDLDETEAARFWPLYDRYQQEMNAVGDRIAAIAQDYIATYRDLGNDKALQLVNDYLAAEAERLALRRTWVERFAAILPGRTVARFFQIENKLDAVIRYDLAATIPVVEERRPAAGQ